MTDLSFGPTVGGVLGSAAQGAMGGSVFGLPGAAAGALISGAANLIGGSATNAANAQMQSQQFVDNAELQAEAQQYNTDSATTAFQRSQQQLQQQEQYNTTMANTAYQRSVADEKAAGLNPIMGIATGGAATPGLNISSPASPTSGASSVGMPTMQNVIGPAISSAMQGAKLAGDLQQQQSQTDILQNNVNKSYWDAINARYAIPETKSRTDVNSAVASKTSQDVTSRNQYGSGGNALEETAAAARNAPALAQGVKDSNPGVDLNNPLAGIPASLGQFIYGGGAQNASPHYRVLTGNPSGGASLIPQFPTSLPQQ